MRVWDNILNNITNASNNPALPESVIISVLLMVLVLSVWEFCVYRLVSHRAFYNKAFNTCLCVLPFFIATIILCLQSNIVITLGTIGALAIIRFRTAVKDPVDMLYLLWSIHIGIVCGCQLYSTAILTSLIVTLILLVIENFNLGGKSLVMVINCEDKLEDELIYIFEHYTKRYRVKSKNYTSKGINFVIEYSCKKGISIEQYIRKLEINKFSIIEYDSDDIL